MSIIKEDWNNFSVELKKQIIRNYWNKLQKDREIRDFDEVLSTTAKNRNCSEERILDSYYQFISGTRDDKLATLFAAFQTGNFTYDVGTGKIIWKGD